MAEKSKARTVSTTTEPSGAVFTRPEVVEFILDLAGYTADGPIENQRVLEPSFGEGDFLVPIVERLMHRYRRIPKSRRPKPEALGGCIRGVELDETSVSKTRNRLKGTLIDAGLPLRDADALLAQWLTHGDFLMQELPFQFDYSLGNPPYVRQEMVPTELIREYRKRFSTVYDRADLYVPFMEKSLKALAPGGVLGFICADRWMKNKYGRPLRQLVADDFHLRYYVDMNETEPFLSGVTAYPAVTVIVRGDSGPTRLAYRPNVEASELNRLAGLLRGNDEESEVAQADNVAATSQPWVLEGFNNLDLVRRLESELPSIEETGCRIGIGVATGADSVFIARMEDLDVEDDRKVPLIRAKDIKGEAVLWNGLAVINPFEASGALVDLDEYPRLQAYLEKHEGVVRARRVAKQTPRAWYRTIDRIYQELTHEPKLLVPDIKADARIVYEDGTLYPHHNLYYITSCQWDLGALRTVLTAGIADLFVSTYSTRMRGGYLRYQAQYLRRIRLPRWENVPHDMRKELKRGSGNSKEAVYELFGITSSERSAMEEQRKARE